MASLPKAGDVLGGKYVLGERLGEGGMGTVFLAAQPALARSVAIKLLHPRYAGDHQITAMFLEEGVAASRVHHRNSVAVIDCSMLDDLPYLVMEHVSGRPLGRIIAEQSVPTRRAIDLVLQILSALEAVHASGVVHADVKSDNFLVDDDDRVTLIDFGLARIDGSQLELRGKAGEAVVPGTPEYMAPETLRGEGVSPATDLYGVGVILYELLTGTTPFADATSVAVIAHVLGDEVVPPSLRRPDREISSELEAIVLRALSRNPAARFTSADAFAVALRRVLRRTRPSPRLLPPPIPTTRDAPTRTTLVPRRFPYGSNI